MNLMSIAFCSLLLLASITACTGAKTQDMLEQVKVYESKHNAYDVEATLALFAKDAVFEAAGQGAFSNPEALRAIHAYDKGIHAQLSFQNCTADGLVVTCEVVEQNDWLAAAGLGTIYYPSSIFTFTEMGQIKRIAATLSQADSAMIGAVLAEFVPWLMTERPEEAKSLFSPDGVFIYGEANGVLVVDLLSQWRAESG